MSNGTITLQDRFKGCFIGLAVGDAIGTTLEFKPPGSFDPIDDMIGGGPFYLKAGQWTDDTSMAICLAESLIEMNGFDASDQMKRYCQWWKEGYRSSTGHCFDIGSTVANALSAYQITGDPFSGDTHPLSAGNGSLMRMAPVVLFFYNAPLLYDHVVDASRTTHASLECIDSCCFFAALLTQCMTGVEKKSLLESIDYVPKSRKVNKIANQSFLEKKPTQIKGSGYVIDCLEAAVWCFFKTSNFEDAVLMAANLGDDADTTAAVCGQIAGAYYGYSNIRQDWCEKLHYNELLTSIADKLYLGMRNRSE